MRRAEPSSARSSTRPAASRGAGGPIFWGLSGLLGGAAFGLAGKARASATLLAAGVAGGLFAASVLVDVLLAAVPMGVSPSGVVWSLWVPVGWGLGLIVYPPTRPPASSLGDAPLEEG